MGGSCSLIRHYNWLISNIGRSSPSLVKLKYHNFSSFYVFS
nr:MAG TPA: hypothetical protein [Crassvirales sp.]